MFDSKKGGGARLPDLPSPKPPLQSARGAEPPRGVGQMGGGDLPEFPDLPTPRGAGQMPVEEEPEMLGAPIGGRGGSIVEMEEWEPSGVEAEEDLEEMQEEESPGFGEPPEEEEIEPRTLEPPPERTVAPPKELAKSDVFVRIDKFHSARKSLTDISERLEDIDELVKKIRETKLREEQELNSWEKDITHIKSRVQTVTENIFEKVE